LSITFFFFRKPCTYDVAFTCLTLSPASFYVNTEEHHSAVAIIIEPHNIIYCIDSVAMTSRVARDDDVLKNRSTTASTINSAALKRFSWTTFEDLIDCLATVHQRMWVIANDLSIARKSCDQAVLQGCEEALKPLSSSSHYGGSEANELQSNVLEAVRVAQRSHAAVWTQHIEEMEVAICAAAPIIVELEACARLWSRGALPAPATPASDEGNGSVVSQHHNLVDMYPTTAVTSSKDASSPPSVGGANHLQIDDSAGFSRSEQSHHSDRATHSPPNIFVRRPSSATLIHPTSFRHETVAAAVAALSRPGAGHSPREAIANERGTHIRLVDLDDSISIVAVESERVTPAESHSRGGGARADQQPSPSHLVDHQGLLGASHEGGGRSSAAGSTKTQTHHHHHEHLLIDHSPFATRAPSSAGLAGGMTAASKSENALSPLLQQERHAVPDSLTLAATPQSAPPSMALASFQGDRGVVNSPAAHHRQELVKSVNTFVAAHSWSPPTIEQRHEEVSDASPLAGTHSLRYPLSVDADRRFSMELTRHSVLFQNPRQALNTIPSAAELLAQRRQSRR
jgi:hypothetical protein